MESDFAPLQQAYSSTLSSIRLGFRDFACWVGSGFYTDYNFSSRPGKLVYILKLEFQIKKECHQENEAICLNNRGIFEGCL